jgi:glycine cleavage system H protein
MASIPEGLFYTQEHEYLRPTDEEGVYLMGITDYAQGELGDVVFVELPTAGDHFSAMEVFGTIEAVKAVSDLYCPVAGEIEEANPALEDDPALVNADPYGEGWMVRIRVEDPESVSALLSPAAYRSLVG